MLALPPQEKTTITIHSENTALHSVTLYSPNLKQRYLHEGNDWFWAVEVRLTDGKGITTLDLAEPLPIRLRIGNRFNHHLFISPGVKGRLPDEQGETYQTDRRSFMKLD